MWEIDLKIIKSLWIQHIIQNIDKVGGRLVNWCCSANAIALLFISYFNCNENFEFLDMFFEFPLVLI